MDISKHYKTTSCSVPGHRVGRINEEGETFYCPDCDETFDLVEVPADDVNSMTPAYRLAKVLWEAKNSNISWQMLVNMAAKNKPHSAVELVADHLALARAVIADGWHL